MRNSKANERVAFKSALMTRPNYLLSLSLCLIEHLSLYLSSWSPQLLIPCLLLYEQIKTIIAKYFLNSDGHEL